MEMQNKLLNFYLSIALFHTSLNKNFIEFCDRLETFASCSRKMHKKVLRLFADAGFFFDKSKDTMECYCCGLVYFDWRTMNELYQMHTPQCRHVIKWKLQNGSLTNTECNELFEEAKQHLTIMRKYLNKNFRPFEIALKLGHSENIIQDVFHRLYFQNQNREEVSASKLINYACTIKLEETLTSHKANQYAQFSSIIQELNQFQLLELKQENIELVMRSLCRICASRNSDLLLQPCNHRAACLSCYTNTVITNCPLCNNFVQDSITISRNDNVVVPQPESTPDNEPHCLVAYILN